MISAFFISLISILHSTPNTNFLDINAESIYFVARGTKNKRAIIADNFNIMSKVVTHIGIGVKDGKENQLEVFNVDINSSGNALRCESLESFVSSKEIFYYGIWELKVGKRNVRKIRLILRDMKNLQISFDHDFHLENGNLNFYCSEFVWQILNKSNLKSHVFNPVSKELDTSSLRKILKRDTLVYIPTDFFLTLQGATKIKEEFPR